MIENFAHATPVFPEGKKSDLVTVFHQGSLWIFEHVVESQSYIPMYDMKDIQKISVQSGAIILQIAYLLIQRNLYNI